MERQETPWYGYERGVQRLDIVRVTWVSEHHDDEGPAGHTHGETAKSPDEIAAFEHAKNETRGVIRTNHRLPSQVWVGSKTLSLPDFAATLAGDDGVSATVVSRKGNPELEKYVATDATGAFSWPIHPEGFSAPQLLDMARLQAWTLKPARLK